MLAGENLSPEITIEISKVRQAMKVNLEHLDSGGKIKDIPNVFETIVLESPIVEAIDIGEPDLDEKEQAVAPAKQDDPLSSNEAAKPLMRGQLTFFKKLKLWLSSPWSVSWQKIGQRNKTKFGLRQKNSARFKNGIRPKK